MKLNQILNEILDTTTQKLWLESTEKQSYKVWHVTDINSARNIMQNGFIPRKTNHGYGVSVSVNSGSAAALFRSLQRMNSFKSFEEVEKWWRDRGATKSEVGTIDQAWKNFQKLLERFPERKHTGHFHLYMMYFHPAQNGDAKVPWDEFLWNDLSRKLVGKQIVAVEATYDGELPNDTNQQIQKTTDNPIEAELFLKDMSLLQPVKILSTPLEIKLT